MTRHLQSATFNPPPPPPIRAPRFEFHCGLCEKIHIGLTEKLPESWTAGDWFGVETAVCGDCIQWFEGAVK